jgi:hypothetical protein
MNDAFQPGSKIAIFAKRILRRGLAMALVILVLPLVPGMAEGYKPFTNGIEYPASFRPYSPVSPWNLEISAHPKIAAYSATAIKIQFVDGNTGAVRNQEAGRFDYGHPLYFASDDDPLINVACNLYCRAGTFPTRIRIPARARTAGASDAHIAIVQPNGEEIDMWAANGTPGKVQNDPNGHQTRDWRNGDTIAAANVSDCGSFTTGTGSMKIGPASTAGGACLGAGILRAKELASGHINHALFLVSACAIGDQYPAVPGAMTKQCGVGVGAPLGGRLWLDLPATTINNLRIAGWEKAILIALHEYGGYLEDNDNSGPHQSGVQFLGESNQPAVSFGQQDEFAALGWSANRGVTDVLSTRWVGADPWNPPGVDFASHMHWLDPCSAKGTC